MLQMGQSIPLVHAMIEVMRVGSDRWGFQNQQKLIVNDRVHNDFGAQLD
jgi:hypothetical protein